MLGPLETVTVKTAFSRSAAAVIPPTTVQRQLRQAAARAVRRVKAGELRPLMMEKPYRIRFCLRHSFTEDNWVRETVSRLEGVTPGGGRGCFAYTSDSAEAIGNLLNEVEWTVLKP
jgi:D-aminopeptidase